MRWSDYCNKILASVDIEQFYYSELKNIVRRGTELKASCPFTELHAGGQDVNPSFTVNLDKGVYYCNTCHSKGNVHTFYKARMNMSNQDAWYALGDALNIPRPEGEAMQIDSALPGQYYRQLMDLSGNALTMLHERRGLSDETIKKFQLGWDLERITIPVYDMYNNLVNIRRYKWDSYEDGRKMINYVDSDGNAFGEVRIFNIQALLNNDTVVWCEGELDAIISEQNNIPACCPTSGAGTFRQEWLPLFRGKTVFLCQDNDQAGQDANESLKKKLQGVAKEVTVIAWPEYMPPKGDITDFYVNLKKTRDDFMSLMIHNEYVGDIGDLPDDPDVLKVELQDSSRAEYVGKRVAIQALVSGKGDAPYTIPRHVKCMCPGPGDSNDAKCARCALAHNGYSFTQDIDIASPDILKLIDVNEERLFANIRKMSGINPRCGEPTFEIEDYFNLEAIRMIPKAITDYFDAKEREYVVRMAYISDKEIKSNRRYTLYGYLYPDPKTQIATHIIDDFTPEKDLASTFELNDESKKLLDIFKPKEGQTVVEKFKEIHNDFERNVTQVWQRHDVQVAVELIYHTVIAFKFQGQPVKRGWGEVLIIGDSGQAKTTITERLMRHFQLGEMHNGESSRRTGLVYNMQQASNRWFLTWGALPLNDSGLVVLDELSGLSQDDLAVMSDVRSSGVARSTGVVTAETNARTRIIFLSNPRNGRQLKTESFGAEAVLKLLGKAEDVRRLDLAIGVASGDVDAALINQYIDRVEEVPHVYTSEACKIRVLWAWSRTTEDIEFTEEATEYILSEATRMGKMYSPRVPIVEGADQRLKIARLSIAAAICTCSTDETYEKVIVTKEHAEFVVEYMDRVYAAPALNYLEMSRQDSVNSDTSDDNMLKLRQQFLALALPDIVEIASVLYQLPYFTKNTLEDYTGLEREDIKLLMKFLTGCHLIEKYKGEYRRRPVGTSLFQNIMDRPPAHDEIAVAKRTYNTLSSL